MDAVSSAAEMFTQLREEFEILDPDALVADMTLESDFASLGLDSLTIVAAIAALEERYKVRVGYEQLVGVETAGQLILRMSSANAAQASDRDPACPEPSMQVLGCCSLCEKQQGC